MAESFGAEAVHLTEEDPRAAVKAATEGRGVDVAIDAVGHPDALELACRLARKAGTVSAIGVYAERIQVHMGIVWIKALTLTTGHANVIGHVDRVLAMMSGGVLDPTPLVSRHMKLEDAAEAYAVYDRREALKIVMRHERGARHRRHARAPPRDPGRGRRADRLEGGLQRARDAGEARHRRARWPGSSPATGCSRTAPSGTAGPWWPRARWPWSSAPTAARSSRCCPRSRWPIRRTSPGRGADPRREHLPPRGGLRPAGGDPRAGCGAGCS